MSATALTVRGLRVELRAGRDWLPVVDGLDLDLAAGELVGLAGESGSGKTLAALALLGLVRGPDARMRADSLRLGEAEMAQAGEARWRALRGRFIAMVFQDPATALDPVFRVGGQLRRALRHAGRCPPGEERTRVLDALAGVGFEDPTGAYGAFPHELSGGMRQRALVAMAMVVSPRVLIADEPTTALDAISRLALLDALDRARRELGTAVLLVSHDLGVLRRRAGRVLVMHAGRIVEQGPAAALFAAPAHPYTRALLEAMPRLDGPPAAGQAAP